MRYKGFYSAGEFSLESIPFETLFLKVSSDMEELEFNALTSHNTAIDTSFWVDAGLEFEQKGGGYIFKNSRAIENFLTLDRVFQGQGSFILAGKKLVFSYQDGKIVIQGTDVSLFAGLILKDVPLQTGNFILKTGFFASRVIFLDRDENRLVLWKKGKAIVKSGRGYEFRTLLKTLGLFLIPLLAGFLLKKGFFIAVFTLGYILILHFLAKWKSKRFFKFL